MSYFLVSVIQSFVLVALLLGLNWSNRSNPQVKTLTLLSLLALIVGLLISRNLPLGVSVSLFVTTSQIIVLLLFFIAQRFVSTNLGYLSQFLLIAFAAIRWGNDPNLTSLTSTSVVNTEFILNLAAVVAGFLLMAFVAALTAICIRQVRGLRWPMLLILLLVLLAPLSGEVLLALIKLDMIDMEKALLTYIARVTNFNWLFSYLASLLLILMAIVYWIKVQKPRWQQTKTENTIAHRKALASYFNARRALISTLAAALLIFVAQLYWDRVASQPPSLSEATPVSVSADGMVHIPLEQVRDGKLHRFVWIADDGKIVRFFIINRYPERISLGVVFDACLLCGDQGYVMRGNQVICVACDVHIFIPSIGKPGGCNPVPIDDWKTSDSDVLISKTSLEAGLNYFSTVVTLEVIDPVSKQTITNTKADSKYTFGGKTYFFANEANYDAFRRAPEQYLPASELSKEE